MAVHLCLDLGTAFSKASAWETGAVGLPRPLRIAEAVGQRDYTLPTAVCISPRGRLYFGQEALEHGRDSNNSSAFIELKQYMTHKSIRPLDSVMLPREYNPTRANVAIRHVVSLYMAFLSRAAAGCLRGQSIEGKTLTMPVLTRKRSANMMKELRLATYYGWELSRDTDLRWRSSSLDLNEALRRLRRLERRGYRDADMPATLEEPLAVMASRMATYTPTERRRRIYMVVDVGAGTTDFGLFVSGNVDDNVGVYALAGSTYSLPIGGNDIDNALIECVLDKSSLSQNRRPIVEASLREQVRSLKEMLMLKEDDNEPMLFPDAGVELTKQEFMDSRPLLAIRSKIKSKFNASLEKIDVSWLALASKVEPEGLSVFFVGGGGRLQFLRDIVPLNQPQSYNHSPLFYLRVADHDPSWAREAGMRRAWQQIRRIFPQMAVSLGGAVVGAGVNEYLNVKHQLERWGGYSGVTTR